MFEVRLSPKNFCRLLSLFVKCAAILAGIQWFLIEQHLSDILAVGSAGEFDPIVKFHDTFLEEANFVGFRAAVLVG